MLNVSQKIAALEVEAKFKIAVKTLLKAPNLTVPEAMLVARFSMKGKTLKTRVCSELF